MTRIALAVVLAITVPFLASAQHHPGSGGPAPSSGGASSGGSSSPGGGFSSGSSGGYSGASSASHSSSSSSGSSGNYSGGSRGDSSSRANAGTSPNGSSSANHSGHTYTGTVSSSSSQPSGARNSANSNIRIGNPTSEGARGNADLSRQFYVGTNSRAGSVTSGSNTAGDVWMHASPRLNPAPSGLDKSQRAIFFAEQMRAMGIETSKSAYHDKLASIGVVEPHRPNWFARMFGAKAAPSKQQAVADIRKPCNGPQCRPWPPPKPCKGPNCKPVNPPPPVNPPKPVSGICSSGFPNANGICQPWGYVGNCRWDYTLQTTGCFINYASFDPGYCSLLLQRIQSEQAALTQLTMQKNMACSNDPQSTACFDLSQRVRDDEVRLESLQRQYQMCRSGAHLP